MRLKSLVPISLDCKKVAWAAGVIEADGTIMFKQAAKHKGGQHPRVRVTMADADIIADLFATFGVGKLRGPLKHSYLSYPSLVHQPEHPKPMFLWEVNAKSEVDFVLKAIRPFLHSRRGKSADDALAYIKEFYPNGF